MKKIKNSTPVSTVVRAMQHGQVGLDALVARYLAKRLKRVSRGNA